jgi:hypothetical protein
MKLKKEAQPAFAKIITNGRYLAFYRNELTEKARSALALGRPRESQDGTGSDGKRKERATDQSSAYTHSETKLASEY